MCACACTRTYAHVSMYICICVCMHPCMYVRVRMCVCTCLTRMCVYMIQDTKRIFRLSNTITIRFSSSINFLGDVRCTSNKMQVANRLMDDLTACTTDTILATDASIHS